MDTRKSLLGGVSALALGAGLLMAPCEVEAQTSQGTVNTQSAYKADAATFFVQNAGGRTTCSTSQDTVANDTITITPPAGNYVYLTGIYIEVAPVAAGFTSATVWSSTNLTGSPAWLANSLTSSASVQTGEYFLAEMYPTGVKSTVAGTAVTILPQATASGTYMCAHAVGFYNPS